MATTTTTTATQRPVRSMKSTWRSEKKDWKLQHHIIDKRGLYYSNLDQEIPVHEKTEKIPVLPEWQTHRYILFHAAIPLAIHQVAISYFGMTFHPAALVLFYTICFIAIGRHQLIVMRRMGHQYGFLDGDKHARDDVPDASVGKTVISLLATVSLRTAMSIFFSYERTQSPLQMDWLMLPLEIGLYGVVLDFWFYWYHRLMHTSDSLWQYHRTHHTTKHPTALLTLYADSEQEILDMVGIPLLTFVTLKCMGLPMGFYEWWIVHQYVVWTELSGHSGLRVHLNTPSTFSWLLKYFDCELVTEDHDLHHRMGWKKSHNYGKQTRLWDKIFGTCHERIESKADNVDYENPAYWPLF